MGGFETCNLLLNLFDRFAFRGKPTVPIVPMKNLENLENLENSYLYLHGFCSSPQSAKAKYFNQRFQSVGIHLICPDLNEPDFATLTLARQIEQVQPLLPPHPTTLIGSSLGGLTAACVAETNPQVDRLVLLAPAFNFLDHWLPLLGSQDLAQWQRTGSRSLYHYGAEADRNLHYGFIEDCQSPQYRMESLKRSLPTLILHGNQDEVIPLEASRNYAASRPWVKVVELASDHSLANVISVLWQETRQFLWAN